jgi:hypothetical protein
MAWKPLYKGQEGSGRCACNLPAMVSYPPSNETVEKP